MFFSYKDYNYVCNLDWLQFSVLTDETNPELNCPSGIRIEIFSGNNIFKNRAIVSDMEGRKMLTLLWTPYAPFLNKYLMTVQVSNEYIWRQGISQAIAILHEIVACRENALGRVDICLDFNPSPHQLSIINALSSDVCYISRKKAGSIFWHRSSDAAARMAHCLSWGSQKTEIKVKLYNKSLELGVDDKGHGEKQYIIDEWKVAGLDVKKVWRLEFSMVGTSQLRYDGKGIGISDILSFDFILGVYLSLYHKRFVVRRRAGGVQGHHNNDIRISFLELPKSTSELKWRVYDGDKPSDNALKVLRKTMAMLQEEVFSISEELFTLQAEVIFSLCRKKGVLTYFQNTYGDLPEVVLNDMFNESGEGCHKGIPKLER